MRHDGREWCLAAQVCTSRAFNCPSPHHQGVTPFSCRFSVSIACLWKTKFWKPGLNNFQKLQNQQWAMGMITAHPGQHITLNPKKMLCYTYMMVFRMMIWLAPRPQQLRQAAYATQPADAAGPNAQMITMPPGVYIVYATRGVYFICYQGGYWICYQGVYGKYYVLPRVDIVYATRGGYCIYHRDVYFTWIFCQVCIFYMLPVVYILYATRMFILLLPGVL